jgi:hypothetical protein
MQEHSPEITPPQAPVEELPLRNPPSIVHSMSQDFMNSLYALPVSESGFSQLYQQDFDIVDRAEVMGDPGPEAFYSHFSD